MEAPAQRLAFSYRDSIADSIAENRIDEALGTLQDFVSNLVPDFKSSVLLLRRRYSQFREDKLKNIAALNEADLISARILEMVYEAERQSAVTPKYTVTAPATPLQYPAPKTSLRVVQTNDANFSEPSTTGQTAPKTVPSDRMETIDEQLRGYWEQYRASLDPERTVACACQNVTKRFRKSRFSLEELSFDLRTGQITVVVGRNASGKTTLLRILLGEIVPDTGYVRYPALTQAGERWPDVKRRIGYIPQFPDRWGGRVKTNLHFVARVHGSRGERNLNLVEWHLHRYGLSEYQYSTWSELSGGFRTRYELVRALISRPRLLILDEPLASLDVVARQQFLKNLRVIAYSLEEPVPIIVTSQHLYEIEAIADQMIVLDDGKCLFCGSLAEIEKKSTGRFYELNTKVPKRLMEERLQGTRITILETNSDGYVVETPEVVSEI
jgi:ABC-2 type transport system ATP-binding protein